MLRCSISGLLVVASAFVLSGCKPQMAFTIVNHGDAFTAHVLCGDAKYDQAVAKGATVAFELRQDSCELSLDGRDFRVENRCKGKNGCSLSVVFPMGSGVPPAMLSGTGSIEVVGDSATIR